MHLDIKKGLQKAKRNKLLLLVTLITVLGFAIRFWNADSLSLWSDEAITGRSAIGIVEWGVQGVRRYDGTIYHYPRGPLQACITAFFYHCFGISTLTTRLPSILWGTLLIPLGWFTGKFFANQETGIILAALIAFHPFQVGFSRYTRFYPQFQFLFFLSVLLSATWTKEHRHTHTILPKRVFHTQNLLGLAFILTVLAAYWTHNHYWPLLLIIPALYATIKTLTALKSKRELLKATCTLLGTFLLFLFIGWHTPSFMEAGRTLIQRITSLQFPLWVIQDIRTHIPLILPLSMLGLVATVIFEPEDRLYPALSFLTPLTIISTVVGSQLWPRQDPRYWSPVTPFLLFFSAYTLALLFKIISSSTLRDGKLTLKIGHSTPNQGKIAFSTGLIITLIIFLIIVPLPQTLMYTHIQEGDEARLYTSAAGNNNREAARYILDHMSPGDPVLVTGEHNSNTFYLGWDQGKIDTIYFILSEPPHSLRWYGSRETYILDVQEMKEKIEDELASTTEDVWILFYGTGDTSKAQREWIENHGEKINPWPGHTTVYHITPETIK